MTTFFFNGIIVFYGNDVFPSDKVMMVGNDKYM